MYNRLLFDFSTIEVASDWRSRLKAQGVAVTDAKAVFDHCLTTGHMAQERQTAIDSYRFVD